MINLALLEACCSKRSQSTVGWCGVVEKTDKGVLPNMYIRPRKRSQVKEELEDDDESWGTRWRPTPSSAAQPVPHRPVSRRGPEAPVALVWRGTLFDRLVWSSDI